MYCKNCGNEIKEEERYCGKCGAKIEENNITNNISQESISQVEQMKEIQSNFHKREEKHATHSDSKKKTTKIPFGLCLIIIISVGVIVCSLILVSRNNSSIINTSNSGTNTKNKIERNWNYDTNNAITDGEIVIHIGDYINYNAQNNATNMQCVSTKAKNGIGDQIFKLTDYNGKWRVLGTENEQILIISEDVISPSNGYTNNQDESYYYINYTNGYTYAIQELNNICSLYGQGKGASSARSINIEDINKITGYEPRGKTTGYEYWVETLTNNANDEKRGIKKESKEYELLFKDNYWLASTYTNNLFGGSVKEYGIRNVFYGHIGTNLLYATGEGSSGLSGKGYAGIRPIIYLDKYVKLVETAENSGVFNIEI